MNKTIFQIDYKISVLIISILGVFVGFMSNAYNVDGVVSFVFHFIKVLSLTIIYLALYLMEKRNDDFKSKLKYIFGYLLFLNGCNLVFSIFVSAHILSGLFMTLSGLASLYMVISFVLEIINLYYKNKFIETIIYFNKKIGTIVSVPIIGLFKNITND